MPFSGDLFSHLFDWEKDPQRQEKIVNSRLEAEFDGVDAGLSSLSGRVTTLEGAGLNTASTTDVLTGTNATKAVTPDALAALWEKGSNVAVSSNTLTLGEGFLFHCTSSSATINDIDWSTAKDGRWALIYFDGSGNTLTHSSTLNCPGAKSISVAAGDMLLVFQDGGDAAYIVHYQRKNAFPGNTQLIYGNIGTASIGAGLTRYMGVGTALNTTAAASAFPMPALKKCQFRNLSVVGINPGAAGETVTCTIHNAGTAGDSSVTCQITNGTNTAFDATNTVTYDNNANDRFSLKIVTSAGCATQTQFFFTCEMIHPVS